MSDNVKLIRDCFDAFGRGDAGFIVAKVSSDVDWRHAGGPEIPYGGDYKGRDGVGDFFTKIGAAIDVLTWEPKHVLPAGDEVVATGHWTGKAKPTGRTFAADWAMVFGVRKGEITSFRVVEDTARVAAAFR
jgi:ketosteroid isomerase-like protein